MTTYLSDSSEDDKKDTFASAVQPVNELESGPQRDGDLIYDNIPEGVNPDLVREEKVIRGLKQRHVQVSLPFWMIMAQADPLDDGTGWGYRYWSLPRFRTNNPAYRSSRCSDLLQRSRRLGTLCNGVYRRDVRSGSCQWSIRQTFSSVR